jgi:dienelactone hydrolase
MMMNIDESKHKAQDFINQMTAGDYASASREFSRELLQALPEAKLKETWQGLIGQFGDFQEISKVQAVERDAYSILTVTSQFQNASLDFRLTFDQNGQIAGLTYQPATSDSPYTPPAFVHRDVFQDIEVTIGEGEWALPGSLSLPVVIGNFPGVILVHGSGPQDRDETIGPNKPFRDLAWGLASQGIAVLRYEKRTKVHASQITPELRASLTVQEEVIDDALAAVRFLRDAEGGDPEGVYVLGHSLGATLAPRIGEQDPSIAGLIVMAGMARPLEDTILDQYTYLASLSPSPTEAQKAELEQLKEKVARVKDPDLSDQVSPKDLPLDIPPAYWLALRDYQPAEVAKSLPMRIFVLQAGRDYQVTTEGDFSLWQKALSGKRNATLKLYPNLFHLFIPCEGPASPQEYLVPGHVSEEVIQDIANWIKKE